MMRVWIMETMIILDKNVMEELMVDMVEEDRDREETTEDNNNSVEKKSLKKRDKDVSLEMLV